jgi:integrase
LLFISDRERGRLNLPSTKKIPTLNDYCQTYLSSLKHSRENTRKSAERAVGVLSKHIGEYRLDKLTDVIVDECLMQKRLDSGSSSNTVNQDVTWLKIILNSAVSKGVLTVNPCKIKKLKVQKTRDKILTKDEIGLTFKLDNIKDRAMILTSLFTGMRLNEVVSLRWADINFDESLITFTQSKTGKTIAVPLSNILTTELIKYKTESELLLNGRIFERKEIDSVLVCRYSYHFVCVFKELV